MHEATAAGRKKPPMVVAPRIAKVVNTTAAPRTR